MIDNNPTREFARFALETKYEDLPPSVVHETKRILMDSIGCAIGALVWTSRVTLLHVPQAPANANEIWPPAVFVATA